MNCTLRRWLVICPGRERLRGPGRDSWRLWLHPDSGNVERVQTTAIVGLILEWSRQCACGDKMTSQTSGSDVLRTLWPQPHPEETPDKPSPWWGHLSNQGDGITAIKTRDYVYKSLISWGHQNPMQKPKMLSVENQLAALKAGMSSTSPASPYKLWLGAIKELSFQQHVG